ncbi:MAG: DNA recombination protein RmuC, partial [Verrucomicrobiota bacterium]
ELIGYSAKYSIILASPTSLIAILRAVAYGWRQEKLATEAAEIGEYGKELYERIGRLAKNFSELRKSLDKSRDAYNKTLSALESGVFVTARKLNTMESLKQEEIDAPELLEEETRTFKSSELRQQSKQEDDDG